MLFFTKVKDKFLDYAKKNKLDHVFRVVKVYKTPYNDEPSTYVNTFKEYIQNSFKDTDLNKILEKIIDNPSQDKNQNKKNSLEDKKHYEKWKKKTNQGSHQFNINEKKTSDTDNRQPQNIDQFDLYQDVPSMSSLKKNKNFQRRFLAMYPEKTGESKRKKLEELQQQYNTNSEKYKQQKKREQQQKRKREQQQQKRKREQQQKRKREQQQQKRKEYNDFLNTKIIKKTSNNNNKIKESNKRKRDGRLKLKPSSSLTIRGKKRKYQSQSEQSQSEQSQSDSLNSNIGGQKANITSQSSKDKTGKIQNFQSDIKEFFKKKLESDAFTYAGESSNQRISAEDFDFLLSETLTERFFKEN